MLDWLRVEYAIEKPSQKLAALTDLDSDAFIAEVKKLRGKKQPLTAASLAALRAEYTNTIDPARSLDRTPPSAPPRSPASPPG